ncbi:MAG TPA: inosine/xanthosine triphosphatase [Symbiobacteriaceae bacterium]|jgi:inosine/xanthosine triphosphatase
MRLAAVGSTNPVKVGAARRIFAECFPDVEVVAVDVPSGVSAQPVGDEETMQGAVARAKAAKAAAGAEFGIGLEGGVTFQGDECWMNGYCAIAHRDGRIGIGKGLQFRLPPAIGRDVRAGGEVGPLMDQLTGVHDSKKKGGAIGFFTNGLVLREDIFALMVAAALVQFLHPELYET